MLKKITQTTATYSLGISPGRHLHKVPSGPYADRMIALMLTSPAEIKFSYADPPYTNWSTPASISASVHDAPFDSLMDDSGNVHLFYALASTYYRETRKLTFSGGDWSVGSAVTVYNANATADPSTGIEAGGKLWVAWSRDVGGTKTLCVKSSSDGGASWGSGPTDPGDVLTTGSTAVYPKLLVGETDIYLVYVDGISSLLFRSRAISGSSWEAADIIASGSILDNQFDAALSSGGLIGVAYDQGQLKFREFDGASWGAVATLDTNGSSLPQVIYENAVPFVTYFIQEASEQLLARFTSRKGGSFSTPELLDPRSGYLDSVLLYDLSSTSYADQTANASSDSTADLYHPVSGKLIDAVGDTLYLGGDRKFRQLYILLSTAGGGGSLAYSYFDGVNWKAFTPSGGNFAFDSTDKRLLLWDDFDSVPSDWQKTAVDGQNRYWVRVQAVSAFTTPPVGSQLTTISDIHSFSVRR